MTAPKMRVLPNVLSNAVAPNTLSGMGIAPAQGPASAVRLFPMRQLWRVAAFAGFGLALLLTIIGGRSW